MAGAGSTPSTKGKTVATMLRLSDEDRETYEIAKEWLPFNDADLDDLDSTTLAEYEVGMNVHFHVLYTYDKPRNSVRWQTAQVWMACRLAGFKVPDLFEFRIKVRKVERREELTEAGDADVPPDQGSSTSTARGRSKKP